MIEDLLKEARARLLVSQLEITSTITAINNFLQQKEANWVIKRVPDTRHEYYVAEGSPPKHVLEVYGIATKDT